VPELRPNVVLVAAPAGAIVEGVAVLAIAAPPESAPELEKGTMHHGDPE
jgi:hypothetical protein